MSTTLDILEIDKKIKQHFVKEREKLSVYRQRLNTLNRMASQRRSILSSISGLQTHIQDIANNSSYNFYITETAGLISSYKEELRKPIKMSFTGKVIKKDQTKITIIKKYVKIASKYSDEKIELPEEQEDKITCDNCGNKKDFEILEDNIYVCCECASQKLVVKGGTSYNDIGRVNISPKYIYDRKIHFRECMNQYQGKQNSTIPQKIYEDLEKQLENHHLLEKSKDKKIRFSKVSKNVIKEFLKELGYTSHYENINLIFYNLTGNKPDDISHLEDILMDDFETLLKLYDKKYKDLDRKSFISIQHILFQLLTRHKHPCKRDDFRMLKTIDRKIFHDEICKELFEDLGWNYTPFY